jgi:hypothetical protein
VSRAGALWNALDESEKGSFALETAHLPRAYQLLQALDADARALAPPTDGFHFLPADGALLPETAAGPRRPAERCEACGEAVTTGLTALLSPGGATQHLGPGCWRERMLARARGDEVSGEQLQIGETP